MEIKINNLYKSFGQLDIIKDLNINFTSKDIHCIFSPSGSGKSTLLNIIAGTIDKDRGKIEGLEENLYLIFFRIIDYSLGEQLKKIFILFWKAPVVKKNIKKEQMNVWKGLI